MSPSVNRILEEFRRLPDEEKREMIECLEAEVFYFHFLHQSLQEWDNPKDDAYNDL